MNDYPPHLDRRNAELTEDVGVTVVCHACAEPLALSLTRLEVVQGRVFHRCPYCEMWSLIRSTDVIAFGDHRRGSTPES